MGGWRAACPAAVAARLLGVQSASPHRVCATPASPAHDSTVGGGGLYNGSDPSYTGLPAYPFNTSSRYFRSRQAGNIAFTLVNNEPFVVTSKGQALYFDWFVDNGWPYW